MPTTTSLQRCLDIDAAAATAEITASLQSAVQGLKKRGAVIAMSGGIDSSVVAALCVRALTPGRVFGLLLPEADSSPDSARLAALLARQLGIDSTVEDIAPTLEALGCYERRDRAVRSIVPEYGPGWKFKIVLPNLVDGNQYSFFSLV